MSIEIIKKEREKYRELYTSLMFSIDDLKRMLDEEESKKRTFIEKADILAEYMLFLDRLEKDQNKEKGFFKKIFKSNDIDDDIDAYLTKDKLRSIKKLENCSKCVCKDCVSVCDIELCRNCREREHAFECNKIDKVLTKSDDTVDLYQGDDKFIFNIAAYLIELDEDLRHHRYVYLIDKDDYDNQHILKYYKHIGEEYYDSVVDDDDVCELERLNDVFIDMGLNV